jgi:lupus La protein
MRRFQPYSAVVTALRDSETLIVLDDGKYSGTSNEAVQRKEPLICPSRPQDDERPPTMEQLFHRTKKATQNRLENSAYAKGFVEEGQDVGQIVLEQFFKPYGAIMVRKRRDEDDNWKGSVFVEFDTQDNMEQFVNLDPKPQFQGRDLTIMTKKGYSEMKCNEKGIVPAWKREDRDDGEDGDRSFRQNNGRGRGRGRGRGDGRGRGRGRGGGGRGRGGSDRFGRERDRRHNRSRSADSVDKDDWNKRRELDNNKDQKRKGPELDADGVPVIQDSRKRKTDEGDHDDGVKKPKMEIKEDE